MRLLAALTIQFPPLAPQIFDRVDQLRQVSVIAVLVLWLASFHACHLYSLTVRISERNALRGAGPGAGIASRT